IYTRIMPTKYPVEVKQRALQLYLRQNISKGEIVRTLENEFDLDGLAVPTLTLWIQEGDWDSLREHTEDMALQAVTESEVQRRQFNAEKDLKDLEKIRDKATDELDGLVFRDAGQAATVLRQTIEQQRELMSGI